MTWAWLHRNPCPPNVRKLESDSGTDLGSRPTNWTSDRGLPLVQSSFEDIFAQKLFCMIKTSWGQVSPVPQPPCIDGDPTYRNQSTVGYDTNSSSRKSSSQSPTSCQNTTPNNWDHKSASAVKSRKKPNQINLETEDIVLFLWVKEGSVPTHIKLTSIVSHSWLILKHNIHPGKSTSTQRKLCPFDQRKFSLLWSLLLPVYQREMSVVMEKCGCRIWSRGPRLQIGNNNADKTPTGIVYICLVLEIELWYRFYTDTDFQWPGIRQTHLTQEIQMYHQASQGGGGFQALSQGLKLWN